MSAWLKRFGLHLAAAVGATGIFVAAAAVGASQTRQQVAGVLVPTATVERRTPSAARKPAVVAVTPSLAPAEATATPISLPSENVPPTSTPVTAQAPEATATPIPLPSENVPPTSTPVTAQAPATASRTPRPTPPAAPAARSSPQPTPAATKVVPERSLAGTIKAVRADNLDVIGVGGREWVVVPYPGALIRLNGKAVLVGALLPGDTVVILGEAQTGGGANRFLAHAITAHRK